MIRAPSSSGATHEYGFTLLELLIALTLTGVLLALLFSGFGFATKARDAGVQRAEANGDLRLIQNLIRRQLHQAQPLMSNEQGKSAQPLFKGQPDKIEFVAPLSQSAPTLYHITIGAEKRGQATRLVLGYRPYFPGTDTASTPAEKRMVLVDEVEHIGFSFFGSPSPNEPAAWSTAWKSTEPLPRLVRLSFHPTDSPEQAWPDLVVATRIGSRLTRSNAAGGSSNARRRAARSRQR